MKIEKTIKKKVERIKKSNPGLGEKIYWIFYKIKYISILDPLRRLIAPIIVKIKYKNKKQKIHLGCGSKKIKGYINIDYRKTNATDLVCDAKKLPFKKNSIEIIESYHLIEHLTKKDANHLIKQSYQLCCKGGKIIIECPDFDEAVKIYLKGNDNILDNIFGLQRYPGDSHLYGYNFTRLKNILEKNGFCNVKLKKAIDYHSKTEPCLRVEAEK